MILDISDASFNNLFKDEKLYLPIRWDGYDFLSTLDELLKYYIKKLESISGTNENHNNYIEVNTSDVKESCNLMIKAVRSYLDGFPSDAYKAFKNSMAIFMTKPLQVYQKSIIEQFEETNDSLNLFRVTFVNDNLPYKRERVFHTPYNLRSKVSTSRYSIAGYPSLYLSTSLELCCEEIHMNSYHDFALASIFKLERNYEHSKINIQVIDLGVKPQDFVELNNHNEIGKRSISSSLLCSKKIRSAYLLWYPLIAACSYIRINKRDPFAAEYIIPQLLMQWVRSEIKTHSDNENERLIGIRYFSAASIMASEMGFDYVFPTSRQLESDQLPYCPVLSKSFYLSNPVYIHEYKSIHECERYLREINDFDFIGK